jgi:hypothetical protein
LIDSGSTNNFINDTAARRAGLHFTDSRGAYVTVANGDRVACRGLAHNVIIRIGEEFFTIDYYSIPLDCYDMILSTTWLRTLGPILWDFDDLCMAFNHSGRRVLWKGLGSTRMDIPPTGRLHTAHLHHAKGSEQDLLDRPMLSYADVFTEPQGLPPTRPCDHRIHLKPATEPVAAAPTDILSCRRMSSSLSVPQCYSRASSGPVLRLSLRWFCWSRRRMHRGGFAWITAP